MDLSVLAAGLSVALAGGDVDVGAGAAEHAVRNNALCFGVCVGVGGALAVMGASWTAYDVSKTYREEGGEAALRQLARDGAIVIVTSSAGAVAYKVGGTVFESGAKAWQAVREQGIWKRSVEKSGSIWSSTKKKSAVENAFGHWKKHKSEFPELQNAKQYVEKAADFLRNPPKGTLTKINSRGDTLRYNPASNTFGVLSKDGVPRTMFRPRDGINYWNKQ